MRRYEKCVGKGHGPSTSGLTHRFRVRGLTSTIDKGSREHDAFGSVPGNCPPSCPRPSFPPWPPPLEGPPLLTSPAKGDQPIVTLPLSGPSSFISSPSNPPPPCCCCCCCCCWRVRSRSCSRSRRSVLSASACRVISIASSILRTTRAERPKSPILGQRVEGSVPRRRGRRTEGSESCRGQ